MKVAVIGASGFLGTAVVERLLGRGIEVAPLIHQSGNAWRLARLGIPLTPADVLSLEALVAAMKGCTHVVNCSRGDDDTMLRSTRNLVEACFKVKAKRLIHIGSVAVYGDPPHPDSAHEDAPAQPEPGSYGWIKLQQDNVFRRAARKGLPSIVLCPPNMSGPFSTYLNHVVEAVRKRELLLLEDGRTPCNLVDVNNLAHAVELSLTEGVPDGRRFFITDAEPATWAQLLREIEPLLSIPPDLIPIERESLQSRRDDLRKRRVSVLGALKRLVSSDVRQELRKDPLLEKVDGTLRKAVALLGGGVEDRLRFAVEGLPVAKIAPKPADIRLSVQQLRGVVHQCDRAKRELGYEPLYSFRQSMAAYRRWYIRHHGLDTDFRDLILALNGTILTRQRS